MNELISEKNSVPKGWIQTELSHLAALNPKLEKNSIDPKLEVSFVPMRCVEELSGRINLSNTRKFEDVRKGYTYFQNHDIIFAKITPCMENGKIAMPDGLKNGIGYGSTEFHVIRLADPKISRKFYFYYFIQTDFRKKAKSEMKGTAGQLRVPTDVLSKKLIPMPPINEQKRIVSKIESIFAQIDAAKQQLELLVSQMTSASGSLAQLKSSILKQAFDGNLASQDSDNKYDANKWIVAKLEDITLFSKNGFTGRPNENNHGIPRLGIETITNSNSVFINTSKCKFIDIPSHRLDNYLAQKNDLFFCRQNGNKNYVGKCCIFIDNIRDTIFSDSLILFRVDCDKIYPNYLAYFVNSVSGRNQIERYCSTTAGNYSINGTNLKKILIKFPSITEQKKIVAKLESIFGNIDTLNLFYFILLGNLFTNLRYFIILYMQHVISEQ